MSAKNKTPAQAPVGSNSTPATANGHANGPARPADLLSDAGRGEHRPVNQSSADPFRAVVAVVRALGSLKLAVPLLSMLVVVLAVGTVAESWYTGKLARDYIYRSWWFNILMGLLFLCILCAALKKYPWKRHQIGFLITHLGLLTLTTGGVVNSMMGVDTLMPLYTFGNEERTKASSAFDIDEGMIEITWPSQYGGDKARRYEFSPGSLTWRDEPSVGYRRDVGPLLGTLEWLANPFPRSWSRDIGGGAKLEILNYFTHVYPEAYHRPTAETSEPGVPAIHFILSSMRGRFDQWIGADSPDNAIALIPQQMPIGYAELLSRELLTAAQVEEFSAPPTEDELGLMGQLVLFHNGVPHRFEVAEMLGGERRPIGESGWSVAIKEYRSDLRRAMDGDEFSQREELTKPPTYPAVFYTLHPPGDEGSGVRCATRGREANGLIQTAGEVPSELKAWYHGPSFRYGFPSFRAVLHFVFDQESRLHFRSFNTADKDEGERGFGLEKTGVIETDEPVVVWGGMEWKLEVRSALTRAVASPLPVNELPGVEDSNLMSAVKCRIKTKGGETKDFWVFGNTKKGTSVAVGDERLQVRFSYREHKMPFELELLRAEQTSDPGSDSPASYSSYVRVTDKGTGESYDHFITMNEPLKSHGFKVFQTGIDTRSYGSDPVTGKPLASSTFTVSSDPGLWLKYAGSVMLAVGVFTMFYMRAYFFKPRKRAA